MEDSSNNLAGLAVSLWLAASRKRAKTAPELGSGAVFAGSGGRV